MKIHIDHIDNYEFLTYVQARMISIRPGDYIEKIKL